MIITYRPIEKWPGELRPDYHRKDSPFRAKWRDTLELLERELKMVGGKDPVIQMALAERDFRIDGQVRADARPSHPGVVLSVDSRHGPLRFATDLYRTWRGDPGWQANLRAIALGLEGLRKFERYGITRDGQQYTGWRAIDSPTSDEFDSLEDAIGFLHDHAPGVQWDWDDPEGVRRAYRAAAKRLHPDVGGDPVKFKLLGEAVRMLGEVA